MYIHVHSLQSADNWSVGGDMFMYMVCMFHRLFVVDLYINMYIS